MAAVSVTRGSRPGSGAGGFHAKHFWMGFSRLEKVTPQFRAGRRVSVPLAVDRSVDFRPTSATAIAALNHGPLSSSGNNTPYDFIPAPRTIALN
jgi:hypothetical protein